MTLARRPLLVGEDNPYSAASHHALWCEPRRSAGGRLCYDILGCSSEMEYARLFRRTNLCARRWVASEARARVAEIVGDETNEKIILLGAKVANAFGFVFLPFTAPVMFPEMGKIFIDDRFVILPHPSGRNRSWSNPAAVPAARAALRAAGVVLP